MRSTTTPYANWRTGSRVSYLSAITGELVTGKAVVIPRRSDGVKFYKVQILTPNDQTGTIEWASERPWILGAGAHEHVCRQCYGPFRSDDVREVLCPTCVSEQRPAGSVDDTFTHLHGVGPRRRRA